MVSLQLSPMWQCRRMQKYCPSSFVCHKQQIPWIKNVYRSATCEFSKSVGPVRYSPKSTKKLKTEQKEDVKLLQYVVKEMDEQVLPMPSHQHIGKEMDKQLPPMPFRALKFQDPGLPELLPSECDLAKQKLSPDEKDLFSGFAKTEDILESRDSSTRDGSSVNLSEVFEANTSRWGVPMKEFLHQASGIYPKETCTKISYKEEENRATISSSKHAAEEREKGESQFQGSSAELARTMLTRFKEARGSVGPIFDQKNGLDRAVENTQKKKNLFPFTDFNVEEKACLRAQSNSFLPKQLRKGEPGFVESKRLPCQDVESFLLKVQKAKKGCLESHHKSQAAISAEGNFDMECDYESNYIDDDEDSCKLLGQETHCKIENAGLVSKSSAAREHAKNQALRYLAMRPYTAFQLKKKLESRDITSELADYAIATVQKCGLQSDLSYAETFSRARFNNSSWGPQRIKLGLQQRGISKELIEVAIASVFREEENGADQCGTCEKDMRTTVDKMSRAAMDQLLVKATKQWNRGRDAPTETKVRRMVAWLQYRGFNYGVIRAVLNHVQRPGRG